MPHGIQQTFDNIQFNLYGYSLALNFFEAIILKARSVIIIIIIIIIITSTGEITIHIRNIFGGNELQKSRGRHVYMNKTNEFQEVQFI